KFGDDRMSCRVLLSAVLCALLAAAALPARAASTIPLTTFAQPYTQNFDTLPASGTFSFTDGLVHLGSGAAVNMNIPGMDGWYFNNQVDATAVAFRVDNGSGTAGGTYSYGTIGSGDRALGSLASTSV